MAEIKTQEELLLQNDETFREEGSDAAKLKGKTRAAEARGLFGNIIASVWAALSGKSDTGHGHTIGEVDNLQTTLNSHNQRITSNTEALGDTLRKGDVAASADVLQDEGLYTGALVRSVLQGYLSLNPADGTQVNLPESFFMMQGTYGTTATGFYRNGQTTGLVSQVIDEETGEGGTAGVSASASPTKAYVEIGASAPGSTSNSFFIADTERPGPVMGRTNEQGSKFVTVLENGPFYVVRDAQGVETVTPQLGNDTGTGTTINSTDDITTEGATNKWWTEARTMGSKLVGYVVQGTTRALAASDTLVMALGIIENRLNSLGQSITNLTNSLANYLLKPTERTVASTGTIAFTFDRNAHVRIAGTTGQVTGNLTLQFGMPNVGVVQIFSFKADPAYTVSLPAGAVRQGSRTSYNNTLGAENELWVLCKPDAAGALKYYYQWI